MRRRARNNHTAQRKLIVISTRTLVLLAVSILFTAPATVWSQERHDGHLWSVLSRELKISYVQGAIDGSALGAALAKEGLHKGSLCEEGVLPAYMKTVEHYLSEVSPSQIADGIDEVFKNYRNQPLLITDAMYVALKSIAGMPPQDIEKLLQTVRNAPR